MSEFTDFQFEIDLSEQQAWDGESAPLVDPGDYTLTVIDVKQKPGQKAPMLAFTFEVQDDGPFKGARVWQNYSLSQNALGRIKQLMVACNTELGRIVASQFLNQTFVGTVYHQEGQASVDANGNPRPAKTFANVKNERALAQPEPEPVKAPPVTKQAPANGKAATAPRRA